jgi:hypothetical protein
MFRLLGASWPRHHGSGGRQPRRGTTCPGTPDSQPTQDSDADRRAAIHRVLDHYLRSARAGALLMRPSCEPVTLLAPQPGVTPERLKDPARAMDWFAAERQVLLCVTRLAADAHFGIHAWQLPWAMAEALDRHGHWRDYAATQRAGRRLPAR